MQKDNPSPNNVGPTSPNMESISPNNFSSFNALHFEKLSFRQKKCHKSLFFNTAAEGRNIIIFRNNSLLDPDHLSKVSVSPALKNIILEKRKNQKKFRGLDHFSQLNPYISENFFRINLEMTEEIHDIILNGLKDHFLFHNLSDRVLSSLIKSMLPCVIKKDTYLFKQGDNASHFFFLEQGVLELYINNLLKKELLPGTAFGELALIYNAVRSASILALADSILWCLDRVTFSNFFKDISERLYREHRNFLDGVSFFRFLTSDQKDSLALKLSKQFFQKNEVIVNQGEIATSFYIVMNGTVSVFIDKVQTRTLGEGQCFGEGSLFEDTNVKGTVVAESANVTCLAIGVTTLRQMFGQNLEKMALRYLIKLAFEKNGTLCHLTEMQKYKIIDLMTIREVTNELIDLEDQIIFVPLQGDLMFENGELIASGEVFGDQFLIESTYKCKGKVHFAENFGILAEISVENFKSTLSFDKFVDFVQENSNSHENAKFFTEIYREDASLQMMAEYLKGKESKGSFEEVKSNVSIPYIQAPILPSIDFIHKIKEGQMALITLVMTNENNFCIMKSYQTSWLSKFKSLSNYVKNEEEVVKFCNFPFIMEYFKSNQEQDYNLLLVKYVKGVDLFEVLRQLGLLEVPQAKFYIGCLILTLQYLHQHHIIYRDLKPDNVMIDTTGFIKLIDMGTAKFLGGLKSEASSVSDSLIHQFKPCNSLIFDGTGNSIPKISLSPIKNKADTINQVNNSNSKSEDQHSMQKSVHNVRTFTIIGTPHYMAPEIILGQGYSFPVDYWALGIMLYEFLCGYVPFGDDMEDPYEIYEKIVKKKGKVKFPAYMSDLKARNLISQLLNKSPDARLGGSFATLKNNEFFQGFDWTNLLNKKIDPPFFPLEGVDFVSDKELKMEANNQKGKVEVIKFLDEEHENIKKNLLL